MNKIVTPKISKEIGKLYLKGFPQRKVGKILGISQDTVKQWLKKLGIESRSLSESHRGVNAGKNNPAWKGGLFDIKCLECFNVFKVPYYRKDNAQFCSLKCRSSSLLTRNKISLANKGKKAWNWKGGITPLYKKIYRSFEYKQWRKECFERDKYICQFCGQNIGMLNVDHIKPFSVIIKENNIKNMEDARSCEELWDINNGRTLCVLCHRDTDTYGVKVLNYET